MMAAKYGLPCPCRECEERFFGCFAECEVYKAWRKEYDAINEKAREQRYQESSITRFKVESAQKTRKGKRKK